MIQKDFFINAIELIPVHGSTNTPTVIHYATGQRLAIGSDAISRAEDRSELIEDFKVDLGNVSPSSTTLLKRFVTPDAKERSAAELTSDFLTALLDEAAAWLRHGDIDRCTA